MRFAGKLHTWHHDRGFGFIRPVDGGQDIFVHVSSLPTPRPGPDEVLTFEVTPGREGKKQAGNVRRQATEAAGLAADRLRDSQVARRMPERVRDGGSWRRVSLLITFAIVAGIGWFAYDQYPGKRPSQFQPLAAPGQADVREMSSPFRCDGRTMCSQMTSCPEATFFLRNCPGTTMDGDNDGVPCEQQWCQ